MFFHIGSYADNFPIHYQHNNLCINVDSGWHKVQNSGGNLLLYKGYIDNYKIEDKLSEIVSQQEPIYTGNFCVIECVDNGVNLKTDRTRSFPIWYSKTQGLNNLVPTDYTCWADSIVGILDNYEKVELKFDLIGNIESSHLTFDQVIDSVDKILKDKIQKFSDQLTGPIRIFLSGGIDTMLLYSYVRKLDIPHTLIDFLHTDLDYFYLRNHGSLLKFWGYRQFHYWTKPSILMSGTPGDEFTARGPTTANMILKYHNTSVGDVLSDYEDSYMYQYFKKYSHIWEEQKDMQFGNLGQTIKECLNILLNDWQHWHLGETISYTPLRDVNIFTTISRLNKNDIIDHVMNASVQKELIKRNAPSLLNGISLQKNSSNYMENLTQILGKD